MEFVRRCGLALLVSGLTYAQDYETINGWKFKVLEPGSDIYITKDDSHYKMQIEKEDLEQKLRNLIATADVEELWIYNPLTKVLLEIGKNQNHERAQTDTKFLSGEWVVYHFHPDNFEEKINNYLNLPDDNHGRKTTEVLLKRYGKNVLELVLMACPSQGDINVLAEANAIGAKGVIITKWGRIEYTSLVKKFDLKRAIDDYPLYAELCSEIVDEIDNPRTAIKKLNDYLNKEFENKLSIRFTPWND